MENIIISALIIMIVGIAVFYIIRAKKKGQKCIGCPESKTCPHAQNGGCLCNNK